MREQQSPVRPLGVVMAREFPKDPVGQRNSIGHSDLAVRKPANPASDCPDALVHPVPASVLAAPPARPLRVGVRNSDHSCDLPLRPSWPPGSQASISTLEGLA